MTSCAHVQYCFVVVLLRLWSSRGFVWGGSISFVQVSFEPFTVLNTMMISKFLEPIYQSLSKVCRSWSIYKAVFQATSHLMIPSSICRIASKTNISGSCRTNRRGSKTTDFISCILAHCGHKYGPNELSHCTHRPMRPTDPLWSQIEFQSCDVTLPCHQHFLF